MKILAIETTGPNCSVAIIDENGKVQKLRSEDRLNHLTSLTPMVDQLLKDQGITLRDVDAVAASIGPGSFTGIRIGVTTARAFCQAMNIPAIAVPSLPSFCYSMKDYTGIIAPNIDARRSQVYGGAHRWEDGELKEVVKGAPYMADEFRGLVEVANAEGLEITYLEDGTQDASFIAEMALEMYKRGETVQYGELRPDYMRLAEAERKLMEQQKK